MDEKSEERLFDTLDNISGGITDLKVQVGKIETNVTNVEKRVDKVEGAGNGNSRRPMMVGAGSAGGMLALAELFRHFFKGDH